MIALADRLGASLSPAEAAARTWDVLVVGAGPAGAAVAWAAARRSLTVLLVDKASFPRGKVCGCCVSAAALAHLVAMGIDDLERNHDARPLRELRLAAGGRQVRIGLAGGVSLSRRALDAAIVRRAIAAGAHFIPEAQASLLPSDRHDARPVRMRRGGETFDVTARVVVAAEGLGGKLVGAEPACAAVAAPASRIGVGATLDGDGACVPHGAVVMACHAHGYVGLVRLEDDAVDLAAALDPQFIHSAGGVAAAVAAVLDDAGVAAPAPLAELDYRGTPRLTQRRRHLGGHRVLAVGDAAGYVEPFTGEGIAWALASGLAVAPCLEAAAAEWSDALVGAWEAEHRRLLRRRHLRCGLIAQLLRRPALTRAAVRVLSAAPRLAQPLVRAVTRPPQATAPAAARPSRGT